MKWEIIVILYFLAGSFAVFTFVAVHAMLNGAWIFAALWLFCLPIFAFCATYYIQELRK